MYKAILKANDAVYKSEGESVYDAISFPLSALDLKTKSDIIIKHGRKEATRHLGLFEGRAILRSHLRRRGLANQLTALLQ